MENAVNSKECHLYSKIRIFRVLYHVKMTKVNMIFAQKPNLGGGVFSTARYYITLLQSALGWTALLFTTGQERENAMKGSWVKVQERDYSPNTITDKTDSNWGY